IAPGRGARAARRSVAPPPSQRPRRASQSVYTGAVRFGRPASEPAITAGVSIQDEEARLMLTETRTADAASSAPKSLAARIIGVIVSPRDTYANVAAHPRWFRVLAVIVLIGATGVFTLMSTDVGKTAAIDQQVRMMESFGMKLTDAQYARLEQGMNRAPYTGAIGQAITLPL